MDELSLRARLTRVRELINEACERVSRSPDEVTLIGVTKTFPVEAIQAGLRVGLRDFGENYLQELLRKIDEIDTASVSPRIRWHFIGHLQRNKVRKIDGRISMLHNLDSLELGKRLNQRALAIGYRIPVLLQVNLAGETTKSGIDPSVLIDFCEQIVSFAGLRFSGLMTIPPYSPDPEESRPWFVRLRRLRDEIRARNLFPGEDFIHLSMGMSNDFVVAVEEGATMVRVGSAIFGPRRYVNT